MDPLQFLTDAHVAIVAGKGGVGKTTVTAVLARAAADRGLRVLVVELDGKPTLASLVGDDIPCLALNPPAALAEYLDTHGLGRIAKRLASSGVIEVVATAAPGIDDIVVLGKIKQLERSGDYDVIVVDGPAAGHATTFLMAPANLLKLVRGGPIRSQATEVAELLSDPQRSQVILVTLPETTPVNEAIETAHWSTMAACGSGLWSSTPSTRAPICPSIGPRPLAAAPLRSSATPGANSIAANRGVSGRSSTSQSCALLASAALDNDSSNGWQHGSGRHDERPRRAE